MVHIKIHSRRVNCAPVWRFAALSAIIVQYLPSVLKQEEAGGSHLMSKHNDCFSFSVQDGSVLRMALVTAHISFTCFIIMQSNLQMTSQCLQLRERSWVYSPLKNFQLESVRLQTHSSVCTLLLLIRHFNTVHQSFAVFPTEIYSRERGNLSNTFGRWTWWIQNLCWRSVAKNRWLQNSSVELNCEFKLKKMNCTLYIKLYNLSNTVSRELVTVSQNFICFSC